MRRLAGFALLFMLGLMLLATVLPVRAADPAQGPVTTPTAPLPVPGNAVSLGGIPITSGNVSGTVTTRSLNLRNDPTTRAGTIDSLVRGTQVSVLGTDRVYRWALVRTSNGKVGWVYLPYLALNGSLPTNKFGNR